MKGKVLDYNLQESKGIISGEDGNRYEFHISEWKHNDSPFKGCEIDFYVDNENVVRDIYVVSAKKRGYGSVNILGGIGILCLLFLGWIPYFGFLFVLVGWIMVSIAIKKLSDMKPDLRIFRKWMISIFLNISAVTLVSVIVFVLILTNRHNETILLTSSIIGGVLFYIFELIWSILWKNVFYGLYEVTNEKLFKTAGTLFLWGGILSAVVIGFLFVFIGWIVAMIAFFSLPSDEG